jgi:uncharacterized membrane protein (DUF485 family)
VAPDLTQRIAAHPRYLELKTKRSRLGWWLTAAMLVVYYGFIMLVAFDKPLLGTVLAPGLSLGIALGAAVIAAAWVVTGVYVAWANKHYDRVVAEARRAQGGEP